MAISEHEYTAPPTPIQHDPRIDRPSICGADEVEPPYPIYMKGPVQHGFKRGSKDLGCPTGTLLAGLWEVFPPEKHLLIFLSRRVALYAVTSQSAG